MTWEGQKKKYQADTANITACENGYIVLLQCAGARLTVVAEGEAHLRAILDDIEWKLVSGTPRRLRESGGQAEGEREGSGADR
jgi:hypothetical protein